jgi:ATP-dependent DNA helicase UvrD/PcrA
MSRDYVLQPFRPDVSFQIDYARELNTQQHAAVTAPPGPALVIAGAGAGKTRTLIFRVAYLLEQGIPAGRILLLTFTNKAAREMMRRVRDLLGGDLTDLWGGTFHAIGHRILRRHADRVGYRNNFTILDREDARDLVKACVADSGFENKETRFPKADVLANIFSMAQNTRREIGDIVASSYDYFSSLAPQIGALAGRYAARKRAANVMDFDDLLTFWWRLLRDQADLLEHYQRTFQFILVDEYQDTNLLQSDIVDLLAARHQNVMVVGDDSQSIYSWRGANFKNILQFPRRYPQARTYKIETNYRSTPEILTLANAAIKPNLDQFQKELSPSRQSGAKPVLVPCQDTSEQAVFVAQRVLELREEGADLNKMAVLYRSHFHALELQLEMTRRNIPFSITSGIRFFEQAHIKDVAAHLKWILNPGDELAFKRIAQMLPGIGGKSADKLWTKLRSELAPALTAASLAPEGASGSDGPDSDPAKPETPAAHPPVRKGKDSVALLATGMQRCAGSVPKKASQAWTELALTVSQLEVPQIRRDPGKMIELILDAGYEDYLKETYTNYRSRLEDLQQLANFARSFSTTEEFLTQLSLLSNLEAEDGGPAARDTEQLRLSTIHQAKGLEFDVVFVIMLCDGLFPSARSLDSIEDEEEERRLFYVAITRARNELYLCYPLVRMTPGRGGDYLQTPSRFLGEIPKDLLEEWNLREYRSFT